MHSNVSSNKITPHTREDGRHMADIKTDGEFRDTLDDARAVYEAGHHADRGFAQMADTWDNVADKLAAALTYAMDQRALHKRLSEDKNLQ